MAIIKAISSKANLKRIINYITNDKKTDINLITGKDCMAESSLQEMQYTKELYKKTNGRQYIHLIQSFSPEDKVTKEEVHSLGLKLAERFTGHQVLIATHIDREHTHNHLVINSVNFEDGRKIQMSKKDLQDIKDFSDKLCIEMDLPVIEKTDKSSYMNTKQYGVAQKGDSWKFKLINAIDTCIQNSNTKNEFIKNMNKLNYRVNWTDTRKYITYTTPEGMKCRDNKLYDNKYTKGEMENGFAGIKTKKSNSKGITSSATNNKDGLFSNRTTYTRRYIQVEGTNKSQYFGNKQYYKGNKTRFQGKSDQITKSDKGYGKRGIYISDGQEQTNRRTNEGTRQQTQNKINFNRISSGFLGIISVLPNQEINNCHKRRIRGYKRSLSKQAMKEYAIKMRNASGFNWEADEEAEM